MSERTDFLYPFIESDEHDIIGERPAREARAGAARNEGNAGDREQPNDCDQLVAGAWEDREARLLRVARESVAPINDQLTRTPQHTTRPNDFRQLIGEVRDDGHWET